MNQTLLALFLSVPMAFMAQTNILPTSGNIGVGTTTPTAKLEVRHSGTIGGHLVPTKSYFTLNNGSNQYLIMDSNEIYGSHTLHIGARTGDLVKFRSVYDNSSAIDRVVIKNNGRVGIGVTAPESALHVSSGNNGDAIFKLEADKDNNNESDNPLIRMRQDGGIIGIDMGFSEHIGDNKFGIASWHSQRGGNRWDAFVMDMNTGNIGIGTSNVGADWKLAVKGKIRAEEIKVETGWADYVFEPDYNLPSLKEVANFIAEKGHLRHIPTAAEVKENGVALGTMNKLLLEKIEELTLYTIQQQKELEAAHEANHALEQRLAALESAVQSLLTTQKP
ncbi:MAG: hypothetical protein AAGF77_07805 [Bacteroidota bacterium]